MGKFHKNSLDPELGKSSKLTGAFQQTMFDYRGVSSGHFVTSTILKVLDLNESTIFRHTQIFILLVAADCISDSIAR